MLWFPKLQNKTPRYIGFSIVVLSKKPEPSAVSIEPIPLYCENGKPVSGGSVGSVGSGSSTSEGFLTKIIWSFIFD